MLLWGNIRRLNLLRRNVAILLLHLIPHRLVRYAMRTTVHVEENKEWTTFEVAAAITNVRVTRFTGYTRVDECHLFISPTRKWRASRS